MAEHASTGPLGLEVKPINLARTFVTVDESADPSGSDLGRYLRLRSGKRQDWDWLLASPVAVILDEAGSGKTTELRMQARRLQGGSDAFFLRIERLCDGPLSKAFEAEEDHQRFRDWLRSKRTAVFLLDSIDEAKLPAGEDANPLHTAIRSLERAVGTAWGRVRLVVSSRPSAWKPHLELAELRRIEIRMRQFGVQKPHNDAPFLRLAMLDRLDETQQTALAGAAQARPGFMDALKSFDALGFAETPLDLLDLVKAHADELDAGGPGTTCLRSLSQIVDRAITNRIYDIGPGRPRSTLHPDRMRDGARKLAAACVLSHQLSIRLPASSAEGVNAVAALAAQGGAWLAADVEQLLVCGLFTAAWSGTVRFHHRRTMERLAAEAFDALLSAGLPVEELAARLTPTGFGEVTVPSVYLETLGWLATLNPAFRAYLVRVAPHILMETGDPAELPIPVREAVIRGHAARYQRIRHRGEWLYRAPIGRFVDPLLAEVCSEVLSSHVAEEPKGHVLTLVELGELRRCLPSVVAIACDETAGPSLRSKAVDVVAALGSGSDLARLAELAHSMRRVQVTDEDIHDARSRNDLRLSLIAACFPAVLTLREAIGLLKRLTPRPESYARFSEYALAQQFAAGVSADELRRTLRWLARLCWQPRPRKPGSWDPPSWTRLGEDILPFLEAVCARLLDVDPASREEAAIALEVERLSAVAEITLSPLDRHDDGVPPLRLALLAMPRLRRAVFNQAVAASPDSNAIDHLTVLERLVGERRASSVEALEGDLEWLLADYAAPHGEEHRPVLSRSIRRAWASLPVSLRPAWRRRLLDGGIGRAELDGTLLMTLQRLRWRLQHQWRRHPVLRSRRERQNAWRALKRRWEIRQSLPKLQRGQRDNVALHLLQGVWGQKVWERLGERYGPETAAAVRTWAKLFALKFDPAGPWGTLARWAAFLGWEQLALDEPGRLAGLTDEQAKILVALALAQLEWPEWMNAVALKVPRLWTEQAVALIAAELSVTPGQPWRHAPTLSLARRQAEALQRSIAQDVLMLLSEAPAPTDQQVRDAAVIVRSDPSLAGALEQLAGRRSRTWLAAGELEEAALWLAIWFGLNGAAALTAVRVYRDTLWRSDDAVMEQLLTALAGYVEVVGIEPEVLAELAVELQRYIRLEDDISPSGKTVGRHHAQDFRSGVIEALANDTRPEARVALSGLIDRVSAWPGYVQRQLEQQAIRAAAPQPWAEGQVVEFFSTWMIRPRNAKELCDLIERQVRSIVIDLETSEFDRRGLLIGAQERDVRALLGEALQTRCRGWYSVTQETVTAAEARTDLRIEGKTADGEIVIVELKIAANWTGDQLLEHIETQLVQQYLISRHVRHGIYLVIDLKGQTRWTLGSGEKLTFAELSERLDQEARRLRLAYPSVDALQLLALAVDVPKRLPRRVSAKRAVA